MNATPILTAIQPIIEIGTACCEPAWRCQLMQPIAILCKSSAKPIVTPPISFTDDNAITIHYRIKINPKPICGVHVFDIEQGDCQDVVAVNAIRHSQKFAAILTELADRLKATDSYCSRLHSFANKACDWCLLTYLHTFNPGFKRVHVPRKNRRVSIGDGILCFICAVINKAAVSLAAK
jgi:hypothetical protein